MDKFEKIKLGISIGDFNGIGIEIILKTFLDKRMLDFCTPIIFGSTNDCTSSCTYSTCTQPAISSNQTICRKKFQVICQRVLSWGLIFVSLMLTLHINLKI